MTRLSQLTTLRLGGPAGRIVSCHTERQLVSAVRDADERGEPILILAGGSNVVVADEGFPGTVARVLTRGVVREDAGRRTFMRVQAGENWDEFVRMCVSEGFAGNECLAGIPGSVGATPIQNVGAYGQDVRETVVAVRAYDRVRGEIESITPEECQFTYRSSMFKREPDRWLVLEVTFVLDVSHVSRPIRYAQLARSLAVEVGATARLADVFASVLGLRRAKGMLVTPDDPDSVSAGSFFLNPVLTAEEMTLLEARAAEHLGTDVRVPTFPDGKGQTKTSAAWLIEKAGFQKGCGVTKGIAISGKHTLALVNRGDGTTRELIEFAQTIAQRVYRMFGVRLEPEPVLVGCRWHGP